MNVNVSIEKDDDQILAMYVSLKDVPVARTVEIEDGACYADEDADGNLIGVEFLAPRDLKVHIRDVARHYHGQPGLEEALSSALETVRV